MNLEDQWQVGSDLWLTFDSMWFDKHLEGSAVLKSTLPDIGHLATWSVSSSKYGFNVECLRDGDPDTFWQCVSLAGLFDIRANPDRSCRSDGPQPHYITLRFSKKVAIQVKDSAYCNLLVGILMQLIGPENSNSTEFCSGRLVHANETNHSSRNRAL